MSVLTPLHTRDVDINVSTSKIELIEMSYDEDGSQVWTTRGKLHRISGPAKIRKNGTEEWWLHGVRHRADGPAVSMPCHRHPPYHEWLLNGKFHRIGGPAVEGGYNWREFFVNDRRFTEDEYYLYVDQQTGEVLVPPGKQLAWDGPGPPAPHLPVFRLL